MNTNPLRLSLLIISVGAFAASIAGYAYLYHDTQVLTEHAVIARNAVADESERVKQTQAVLALASSTIASRERLSSFFVPASDAVKFIRDMEAIGPASGATIAIASIVETAPNTSKKEVIGSLTAHVTINGSWSDVMQAMELFEVLPYQTRISRMALDTAAVSAPSDKAAAPAPTARAWQAVFDISASTHI